MRELYQKQVSLLLDVLPIVSKSDVFALKGGTAINLFFRDCPRLSVDIDIHYLPDKKREEALADIQSNMEAIKVGVETAMQGARVTINPRTFNTTVEYKGVLIKVEPNTVIRGTLLPPVQMSLCPSVVKSYNRNMSVTCVAREELFAGKLCAALQRQHPRDLFDVLLLLHKEDGLSRKLIDVFIVYLISQGKPIHEMLNPNIHNIENLFNKHFQGMTKLETISLETLIQVQKSLPQEILGLFTKTDQTFIMGFKSGNPDWNLLSLPHAQSLPAVRWKQMNLERMSDKKRQQAIDKLKQVFK